MDIKNKVVMILGGWGLVGNAVTRKLVDEGPKQMIITSLKQSEAEEAVAHLQQEFPDKEKDYFIPFWGDLFTRYDFKDQNRIEVLNDSEKRQIVMKDIMEELTEETLQASTIYQLISKYKPQIVIDSINTATGIAYQDIYTTYRGVKKSIREKVSYEQIVAETEKLMCTLYVPQLIRHIQIIYNSMERAGTEIYIKVGTSGTGGMGLNIPYTHSEEKPSRVLLSKSSVAGAHTLLLFLMGRTPGGPIIKEIKPTALIAWKKIAYGEVKKRGMPVQIEDIKLEDAVPLKDKFLICQAIPSTKTGETLKAVYIDTGENGIFARGEFETITAQKQMEFVTPEEIADSLIYEIKGGSSGHDIINALDNATLEPTYRAGYLQHMAIKKLERLEKEFNKRSVAFELLGPPRLSKLLYEIHLINLHCKTMHDILNEKPDSLSKKCFNTIKNDTNLKNEILSIGIPILLPDGKNLLRGNIMKIPPYRGENELDVNDENINTWAKEGWVDLRVENMDRWQKRIKGLIDEAESISEFDTSSMHVRTREYWDNFEEINIGKICSWLFIHEEKGKRMKA